MVLPAPAPDDAPAPADLELLEQLRLSLRFGAAGVLVLVDRARPERLGPLVRALLVEEPGLEVHVDALRLAQADKGSAIVLIPDVAQAKWLNLERPILAERSLRVILFSDAATSGALAHGAPDFFHWISHWTECPPGPWRPAVLGIRAAAAAVAGITWKGGDLDAAFEAALPDCPRTRISAAAAYEKIVEGIRGAGDRWVEIVDIDGLFRLRRVRWAMAEAGRTGRVVLIEPAVPAPGFWPAHGQPMPAREACRALEDAGAAGGGRLAALLDLEPEAVDLAEHRLRHGATQAEIEALVALSDDPGAALARLAGEGGTPRPPASPPWARAMGAEGEDEGRDAPEAAVRAGQWVDAARRALEAGDPDVAERWARRAADGLDAIAGDTRLAGILAVALTQRGKLDAAAALLREAIAVHERDPERKPGLRAALLGSLGDVLRRQGDLAGAREQIERGLRLNIQVFGMEDRPEVASSLHQLAVVLQAQGDLAGARAQLERALQIGTEDNAGTAASRHDLARVLLAQGDLAGARAQLESALRIKAKVFGTEDHLEVAASMHQLAVVLHAQGDLAAAREHLERALQIKARVLGTEDHPSVAVSLHELARVLMAQGDLVGAREHLERALQIKAKVFGTEDHPEVAASLHELARVLLAQGDLAAARDHLERILAIDEHIYGTRDHPSTAMSELQLAVVLLLLGEGPRALELLRQAHRTLVARVGPDHPDTQKAADLLAQASPPDPAH